VRRALLLGSPDDFVAIGRLLATGRESFYSYRYLPNDLGTYRTILCMRIVLPSVRPCQLRGRSLRRRFAYRKTAGRCMTTLDDPSQITLEP
jgi:hypothetical protein